MGNLRKIETELQDCYIIEPKKYPDERGHYQAWYIDEELEELEITTNTFAQCSDSVSSKGTLRGLHYQHDPFCQAKFVRCPRGAIVDVVVDLRKDSPTYKKWLKVELNEENLRMLYVPRGFAHGYICLKDNSLMQYAIDNHYRYGKYQNYMQAVDKTGLVKGFEDGIRWDDPEIGIDWELDKYDIDKPLMKEDDLKRHTLSEYTPEFYMKKRYLITGFRGQLGYDVVRELNSRGIYDILALDVEDVDITKRRLVEKIIFEYNPEYVIHCAAYTAVDKAEECEDICRKVNFEGTRNIAEACRRTGAKMVYISTDYVFDGTLENGETYKVTDTPNPKNVYGVTKLEGEKAALENPLTYVIRTAWVFGKNGNNFIKTMLKLSEQYPEVTVVNDQIGTPTYTVDLAKYIVDLIGTEYYGIHHFTNSGKCSWAEFAAYILKDTNTKVKGVTTEEYYAPKYAAAAEEGKELHIAYRPKYSVLDKSLNQEQGFGEPQTWQEATDAYIEEIGYQKKLGSIE